MDGEEEMCYHARAKGNRRQHWQQVPQWQVPVVHHASSLALGPHRHWRLQLCDIRSWMESELVGAAPPGPPLGSGSGFMC